MTTPKPKRVHFTFSEAIQRKLEDLRRLFMMESRTDVMRKLIEEKHSETKGRREAMERAARGDANGEGKL